MSDKYKFKSVGVYKWNTESGEPTRFRTVFYRYEVDFMGVELEIFNKKFDEEPWNAKFEARAYYYDDEKKGKEICRLSENEIVDDSNNTYKFRKGWGDEEEGKYWKKGEYLWEVYIDNEFVGSSKFIIEDLGENISSAKDFFDVVSLRLYEGPTEDVPQSERVYLRKFDAEKTRFVFGELKGVNLVQKDWLCEIFFNYYDDTRRLIGRIPIIELIRKESDNDYFFMLTHGWGNNEPNNWNEDEYTLEVEFMEKVMTVTPFTVGNTDQEDVGSLESSPDEVIEDDLEADDEDYFDPGSETFLTEEETEKKQQEEKKKSIKKSLKELDELVGLKNIKNQIREHITYIDFLQVRKEMGIEEEEKIMLHSVFTGNPGTGKTTVVKLLGKIYNAMGLLSKGHVHAVESSDLVSGFVRQTGSETEKEIEKARGGILFIDEAYMLFRKGVENDFGGEAVAALITEMSDGPGDIAIMVAGYPAEMKDFIESNPGLKSRFKKYFHFDDYTPGELIDIAFFAAEKKKVELHKDAADYLKKELTRAYRKRDKSFGNARLAHSVIDEAKINMGVRVMKKIKESEINKEMLSTIMLNDIKQVFKPKRSVYVDIPTDEELLTDTVREMDSLVGLTSVKQEVRDLIKLVRYYREIGKDVRNAFPIHSIFKGNPGTGKTTFARILANIYKSLGVLERGHVIETDSSDLIAGYLGQTAIRTKEKVFDALGGILFIDEAYSLTEGQHPEFGKKAVATLIKQMEDKRGDFGVIVAGYTRPMNVFVESNPGIKSRFDQTMVFEDFTEQELYEIAVSMLLSFNLELNKEASEYLKNYLNFLFVNRNQYFGNARSVRKIVERIQRNQNLRMASLKSDQRTTEELGHVILKDVQGFQIEESSGSKSIGFKK